MNIKRLLAELNDAETALRQTQFLAPCVKGGMVRTRMAGLVYSFQPQPEKFEGWGIFQPLNERTAKLASEADLPLIERYLQLFKPLRVRLSYQLSGQSWLGYPCNESDARQRFGKAAPIVVNLVNDANLFDQIIAHSDGKACWFREIDRRSDPLFTEQLRDALRSSREPEAVKITGATPEIKIAYQLAFQQLMRVKAAALRAAEQQAELAQNADERRLRQALKVGGGKLREYQDRGEYWLVEWQSGNGQYHSSAISKRDLTVMSAGICLSGRDRDFDLQSLVKVVEHVDWYDGG